MRWQVATGEDGRAERAFRRAPPYANHTGCVRKGQNGLSVLLTSRDVYATLRCNR